MTHTRFELGCTCGVCQARYIETYANSHTYGAKPWLWKILRATKGQG